MGLLSGVGQKLNGLFGNADFGDGLAQAQAYLDGDYGRGIDFAAKRFRRRRGGSAMDALANATGNGVDAAPDVPASSQMPPVGAIVDGHRFLGGDPNEDKSWQPVGGMAVGAGGNIPGDFGTWY
ncbi:MAG: hypothetical protein JWO81_569 [Alphaproteobacteria bacterium]|nr:hypothetical protein [Alphaproteobacteria bacterium]